MIGTGSDPSSLYLKNYVTGANYVELSGSWLNDFHVFEVLWKNNESTGIVDHGASTSTSTLPAQVPIIALPVTFYNHLSSDPLLVDWMFVRQYCGEDLSVDVDAPTSVTVADFNANPNDVKIQIKWQTSLEIDLVGFNLYRSTSFLGEKQRLNQEIIRAASPGDIVGASYVFVDEQIIPGVVYYYWLEPVDIYGKLKLLGPVTATGLHVTYLPLAINR